MNTARNTVLFADDDEPLCTVMSWAAERHGFTVLVAHSVGDVRRLVADATEILAAAIVDLELMDGTGWEVAEIMWERYPKATVVIPSGFGPVPPPNSLSVPTDGLRFLPKPYTVQELCDTLSDIVCPDGI